MTSHNSLSVDKKKLKLPQNLPVRPHIRHHILYSTSLETSDPVRAMAMPMSERFKAGESFTPSPVTLTMCPRALFCLVFRFVRATGRNEGGGGGGLGFDREGHHRQRKKKLIFHRRFLPKSETTKIEQEVRVKWKFHTEKHVCTRNNYKPWSGRVHSACLPACLSLSLTHTYIDTHTHKHVCTCLPSYHDAYAHLKASDNLQLMLRGGAREDDFFLG